MRVYLVFIIVLLSPAFGCSKSKMPMPDIQAGDAHDFSNISIELSGRQSSDARLTVLEGQTIDATIQYSTTSKDNGQRAGVCNISSWNGEAWVLERAVAFQPASASKVHPGSYELKFQLDGLKRGKYRFAVIFGSSKVPVINELLTVLD